MCRDDDCCFCDEAERLEELKILIHWNDKLKDKGVK